MRMHARCLLAALIFAGSLSTLPTALAKSSATAQTGSLSGVITDATTNKPLAGVIVSVDYTHQMLVAETDRHGRYTVHGIIAHQIATYAFAPGYIYHHGVPQIIKVGKTTVYSYAMARDTLTNLKHPKVTLVQITPRMAKAGQKVHFSFGLLPGETKNSLEIMATSAKLGRSVLLLGVGHSHYGGDLLVTPDMHGTYTFRFFGAGEDCLENTTFPALTLTVS